MGKRNRKITGEPSRLGHNGDASNTHARGGGDVRIKDFCIPTKTLLLNIRPPQSYYIIERGQN